MKDVLSDKERAAHEVGMTAANKVSFEVGDSGAGIGKEVAEAYNAAHALVIAASNVPTEST